MVKLDAGDNGPSLIRARRLDKTYRRGGEEIHVLQGLNLDVDKGDFVAFMGPSGSGKTTLLNLLGGLDVPSAGSITVAGDEITRLSRKKLTQWRARHVGFVFQVYNLIPVLTAFQNVELPLLLTPLAKAERRKRVETALGVVSLADRILELLALLVAERGTTILMVTHDPRAAERAASWPRSSSRRS